ncbi:MAG: hypothetical protein ACK4EX_00680 [Thermaurantimonas sp.]|uniref:hypothetical protein n=1 Tax=Thermaurantimonas sp. TaxID=2681568 RepID=UPI00391DBD8D
MYTALLKKIILFFLLGRVPDEGAHWRLVWVGLVAHIRLVRWRGTSGCGGFTCRLLALCAACPLAAAHTRHYPSRAAHFVRLSYPFSLHWNCLRLLSLALCVFTASPTHAQFRAQGYLRYFPILTIDRTDLSTSPLNHTLHQRLNLSYHHRSLSIYAGQRTRLFSGPNVSNPFFKAFLETDLNGPIDASYVLLQHSNYLLHTITDRLYLDFKADNWQLSIGRQRINWGINPATNPQDLFNNYSFFDFDYQERPGADALRFQRFLSPTSRFEIALAPGRKRLSSDPGWWQPRNSVAAALYSFNISGYDLQFTAGYFRHRWHAGFGWAGALWKLGFKGEFSYFRDLEPLPALPPSNYTATISLDYGFGSGLFITLEATRNKRQNPLAGGLSPLTAIIPRRADDVAFSEWQVLAVAAYPISPVQSANFSAMWLPDERIWFAGPSYTYSVWQNIDLNFLAQLFFAPTGNLLNASGYNFALLATWSF